MGRKLLFIALVWLVLGTVVFVFYLLRETSPMKEFIAWALSVWPIMAVLITGAGVVTGWILGHDFAIKPNTKELNKLRDIGVQLRNQIQYEITSHEELVQWFHMAEAWARRVVTQIEPIDQTWAGRIRTLNKFAPNQALVPNPIVERVEGIEHQRWADIQNERLTRLDGFLAYLLSKTTTSSGTRIVK